MPQSRIQRARGARLRKNAADEFVTVPASEVQIGDQIVFDQQPAPYSVTAISEEEHNGVAVRRISSELSMWIVPADHEIRKVQ